MSEGGCKLHKVTGSKNFQLHMQAVNSVLGALESIAIGGKGARIQG